jgi:hypothetical protein
MAPPGLKELLEPDVGKDGRDLTTELELITDIDASIFDGGLSAKSVLEDE